MREQIDAAAAAIKDAASNPKVAFTAGVAIPGASSIANTLELITGWTGAITGILAACTGAVFFAIKIIELARELRRYRRQK